MEIVELIKGERFEDDRGSMRFANSFAMDEVKRFYMISPADSSVVRAWQGHRIETKWFMCIAGSFTVRLIKIDDWESPSKTLEILDFKLNANEGDILKIPGGYVNGFNSLEANSQLMVFSDQTLEVSKKDDYRFPSDYWGEWKQ